MPENSKQYQSANRVDIRRQVTWDLDSFEWCEPVGTLTNLKSFLEFRIQTISELIQRDPDTRRKFVEDNPNHDRLNRFGAEIERVDPFKIYLAFPLTGYSSIWRQ